MHVFGLQEVPDLTPVTVPFQSLVSGVSVMNDTMRDALNVLTTPAALPFNVATEMSSVSCFFWSLLRWQKQLWSTLILSDLTVEKKEEISLVLLRLKWIEHVLLETWIMKWHLLLNEPVFIWLFQLFQGHSTMSLGMTSVAYKATQGRAIFITTDPVGYELICNVICMSQMIIITINSFKLKHFDVLESFVLYTCEKWCCLCKGIC